jgi:hypothetical protein
MSNRLSGVTWRARIVSSPMSDSRSRKASQEGCDLEGRRFPLGSGPTAVWTRECHSASLSLFQVEVEVVIPAQLSHRSPCSLSCEVLHRWKGLSMSVHVSSGSFSE